MKIKVKETSIEADARELSACNTLADNFSAWLSQIFASGRAVSQYDKDEEDDEEEDEAEND